MDQEEAAKVSTVTDMVLAVLSESNVATELNMLVTDGDQFGEVVLGIGNDKFSVQVTLI